MQKSTVIYYWQQKPKYNIDSISFMKLMSFYTQVVLLGPIESASFGVMISNFKSERASMGANIYS